MTALKIDAGLPPARLKRRKYMSTALLLIDELGFEPRLNLDTYGGGFTAGALIFLAFWPTSA